MSNAIPRPRARSRSTPGSPRMTMRPGCASAAARTHRSGPMPAGSPAVNAMRGAPAAMRAALLLVEAVLDEGAIARLAQPVLVRLVGLAGADRQACRVLLAVAGELVGAPLEHLDE